MAVTAICIGCGCDEQHACEHGGTGCWWLRFRADINAGVCSRCEDLAKGWDQGQRSPILPLIAERFHRQVMFLYEDEASARAWVDTPQPALGARSARELIIEGRIAEVQAVIDQLRSGAYA